MNAQFSGEEYAMALSQSDLIRLLESLRSSDGIELVRSVAERMLQELIEAEASSHGPSPVMVGTRLLVTRRA
ncbi:hypothetical protein WKI67_03315 [Streptomyces sp. MS2.AVA.5]|uniref:Uncharacterized protein n=1 Tax=Streptomyces achmelvichensis TaxID=3134111 RepID=A0ACC6PM47_9ACTN